MSDVSLALALLNSLAVAVLRRVGPGNYTFFGQVPGFYAELFDCTQDDPNVAPWLQSDMLHFFLDDAETFFESGQEGSLHSGIWQEDGVERGKALTASAVTIGDENLLVVRCLSDDYVDRARILQRAREHLLERRDLEMYKQKSQIDALTTLYNRAAFMELLHREVALADNSGRPLGVLFLDIDDFKKINDTFGHLAGDSVLSTLGRLLRSSLRREDQPARYGGEEFAILVPNSETPQVLRLAKKLCSRIGNYSFGALPPITVSIGYTSHIHGETPENLIQRADTALYDAKHAGKNCVRFR